MQKTLSVIVAAAFAAASLGVAAQTKDVTTKGGGAVTTKDGKPVTTRVIKETPKPAPAPKEAVAEKPAKPKSPGSNVTTKGGGPVTTKDGKAVTTKGQ